MLKKNDLKKLKNVILELQAINCDVENIIHRYKRDCTYLGTAFFSIENAIVAVEKEVQNAEMDH